MKKCGVIKKEKVNDQMNNFKNEKEIITVTQLPVIEQALDNISSKIEHEIQEAKNTLPSDLSKTTVHLKKLRAKLKKEFEWIESQRKTVKSEILKPYLDFEVLYKSKISDKFKEADKYFKSKISEIESEIKSEKEAKLKDYFIDVATSKDIKYISFEDLNLKINLSDSLKSYYSKINEITDNISNDLKVLNDNISDEKTKYEIILDYKKTLNLAQSMILMTEKQNQIKKIMEDKNQKEVLEAPSLENEEKFEMSFTVTGTKKQLKALKDYLIQNNLI